MLIRALHAGDIDQAVALSDAAEWNQTAADWRMLLELAPDGCFAIDCEGQLAATTTLLCFGTRLAWLGMVLTAPKFRGRGFARALVEHALAVADSKGIETVKLDATDQGRPIYERYGFRFEQDIERWAGRRAESPPEAESLPHMAFEVDRAPLLASLAARGRAFGGEHGYALTRDGRRASFLGPCVARDSAIAEELIGRALAGPAQLWYWDLLPANADAVRLARQFGFQRARRLARMVRGAELREREEMIFATAGFELG